MTVFPLNWKYVAFKIPRMCDDQESSRFYKRKYGFVRDCCRKGSTNFSIICVSNSFSRNVVVKEKQKNATTIQMIIWLNVKIMVNRRNLINHWRMLKIMWDRLNNNFTVSLVAIPELHYSNFNEQRKWMFRFPIFLEDSKGSINFIEITSSCCFVLFLKSIFLQFPQIKTLVLVMSFT